VNQSYKRLFGDRDFIGKTVYEAFPDLAGQGFYEWLDQVYQTGQRLDLSATPISLSYLGAPSGQRFLDFIYEPLLDESGTVTGIFCEGFDVTDGHVTRTFLEASLVGSSCRPDRRMLLFGDARGTSKVAAASNGHGCRLKDENMGGAKSGGKIAGGT
jgi:hypothetical protein